jgi:hypothetical protein
LASNGKHVASVEASVEANVWLGLEMKHSPTQIGSIQIVVKNKVVTPKQVYKREALCCKGVGAPATKAKPSVTIHTFRFFSRGFAFPLRRLKKLFSQKGLAA